MFEKTSSYLSYLTTKHVVYSIPLISLHRKAASNRNDEQTTAIYMIYIYTRSGDYLQCFFKHEHKRYPSLRCFLPFNHPTPPLSKADLQLRAPTGAGRCVLAGLPCMIVNVTYLLHTIIYIYRLYTCMCIYFFSRRGLRGCLIVSCTNLLHALPHRLERQKLIWCTAW